MEQMQLTLKNLVHVSAGEVAVAFDDCLRRAVRDLDDRPTVKTSRSVQITLELKPVADEKGNLVNVSGIFHFNEKIPGRNSTPCNFNFTKRGGLIFSPFSPEDADQMSLPVTSDE